MGEKNLDSAFSGAGFSDPDRAGRELERIGKSLLGPGIGIIREEALKSASPEEALNNIERISAVISEETSSALAGERRHLASLVGICGASELLTNSICAEPALLDELLLGGALEERKELKDFLDELTDRVAAEPDSDGVARVLRRYKRREYLRIGARDLLGLADVVEVTAEIADLASASLEAALSFLLEELKREFGAPL